MGNFQANQQHDACQNHSNFRTHAAKSSCSSKSAHLLILVCAHSSSKEDPMHPHKLSSQRWQLVSPTRGPTLTASPYGIQTCGRKLPRPATSTLIVLFPIDSRAKMYASASAAQSISHRPSRTTGFFRRAQGLFTAEVDALMTQHGWRR